MVAHRSLGGPDATCKDETMSTSSPTVLGLKRGELIALLVAVPLVIIAIVLAKPLITDVLNRILNLPPWLVFVVVGALVFAEAAVFFGFIFPGETAVILGGVVASGGNVNIVALTSLVVVCAIAGDSVGYWVGRTFGDRVLEVRILESRRGAIDGALELLRRRGGIAVILGRFTAFLRAVTPGLAGASRMHYRTFFIANAIGGVIWGVLFTLLGYFLGNAYHRAEKYASWVSMTLLIIIVLVATGLFIRGRIKEERVEEAFEADVVDEELALREDLASTREQLEGPERP
jgi:membrane protein DedA with SNARE-associated domain